MDINNWIYICIIWMVVQHFVNAIIWSLINNNNCSYLSRFIYPGIYGIIIPPYNKNDNKENNKTIQEKALRVFRYTPPSCSGL